MKSMFRRRSHDMPMLNLASLPDLIFTVLFFFMIVTHMRNVDPKVSATVPQGKNLTKMGHKSSVIHLYIGRSIAHDDGDFHVQLGNRIVSIDQLKEAVEEARSQLSTEDQTMMTVAIKADRDVPMGLIADVKQQLQQAMALHVSYAAVEK